MNVGTKDIVICFAIDESGIPGTLLRCNSFFTQLLGYTQLEIEGMSIKYLIEEHTHEAFYDACRRLTRTGQEEVRISLVSDVGLTFPVIATFYLMEVDETSEVIALCRNEVKVIPSSLTPLPAPDVTPPPDV